MMQFYYRVVAVLQDESVVSQTCETDLKTTHVVAEYLQAGAKEIRVRKNRVQPVSKLANQGSHRTEASMKLRNLRLTIQNPAFMEKGVRRSPFQKDSYTKESDDGSG